MLSLVPGSNSVDLMVTTGGGIALLRSISLRAGESPDGTAPALPTDSLARELRITLGQLPPAISDSIRRVQVFGPGEDAAALVRILETRLAIPGSLATRITQFPPDGSSVRLPDGTPVSVAAALALQHLASGGAAFEFLPPKVSHWQRWAEKYPSRRLAWAGAGALGLLLITGLAFSVQQAQLLYWRAKWRNLRQPVAEAAAIEQRVRQFRPWFDTSCRSLSILRRLTEAFPEEGTVSAKSVDIRPGTGVTCTGTARDNQALLRMGDRLRAMPEVTAVKFEQIRGNAPIQFTVNFQWKDSVSP